ncbi:MAG: hypothetical protein JO332_20435 [Planctomycetaceae bacterium]|nr:hypothetical protein [Planctomycetaceae bacterium]
MRPAPLGIVAALGVVVGIAGFGTMTLVQQRRFRTQEAEVSDALREFVGLAKFGRDGMGFLRELQAGEPPGVAFALSSVSRYENRTEWVLSQTTVPTVGDVFEYQIVLTRTRRYGLSSIFLVVAWPLHRRTLVDRTLVSVFDQRGLDPLFIE